MVAVSAQLTHDVTAVDWSSDGTFLAVGDRNGSCTVLDAESLQVMGSFDAYNVNKKDAWVEVVKISPDSSMIAFGTHGGCSRVELAKVTAQKKVQKIASANLGLSSALNHMDWSMDGQFLVLNSQANELMWMSVDSKKQVSASSAKDIDWYTWTCIFGFPVQGIWPGLDYTNIKTVDRSHSGTILATGDDFGTVKLF